MHARALKLAGIACLLGVSMVASGCGMIVDKVAEKTTEQAIENATGGNVDIDDDTVNIEGDDGSSASLGEGAKVPSDFPSDVTVYEGEIKAALTGNGSWTLSIETPDDAQTVLDFYAKELEADGWTKESTVSTDDGGMYSAKKDNRVVTVVVATNGGESEGTTGITLSVSTTQ